MKKKAEATKGDRPGETFLVLRPFRYGGDTILVLTNAEARALRDSLTAVLAEGDNRV